jgi:hypothetical protein
MLNSVSRSRTRRTISLLFGALLAVAALGGSTASATPAPTPTPNVDVAAEWFQVTTDTVAAAAISAQASNSRIWALSWSAAYNSLTTKNSSHRWFSRGRTAHFSHKGRRVIAASGVFADAAVASAVHDTLAAQVPVRQPQLDAALATTLARLPDGWQKSAGVKRGQSAATKELADRADDGLDFASVNLRFTPGAPETGLWQFTPPFAAPVQVGLPDATPFYLGYASRFRPRPAPGPGTAIYRHDFNESKAIGGLDSTLRTQTQTDNAKWISQTSVSQYTQALKAIIAATPNKPLVWKTSLVAAFHTITADAQIAVFEAKYHYQRWRPYTEIRSGDTDGDPQTIADPNWAPLINSPQHPEYPSGHLTYAGAATQILTAFVGPNAPAPFTATSPNAPGVVYSFGAGAWKQLLKQNDDGRVWSGIHFRNSDKVGAELGENVANYDLWKVRGQYVGL